jgi:hypothetical protein
MRCDICDSLLANPTFNRQLDTWEPCETCTAVIVDCLNDLKDNAVFVEDDEVAAAHQAGISLTSNDFT